MRGPALEERARRAGRRVRRYSRLVSWMKVALPLGAVALLAALYLGARDGGDVSDVFTAEELARLGAGMRLENPRFAGVTDAGEPFTVRADWAVPDGAMPRVIDLERPRAEIGLKDGRTVTVVAAEGRLNRRRETATLTGGVTLETSDGYRIETARVRVDFAEKTARAPGAVTAEGPRGSIEAGSMRAEGGPEGLADGQIWFENRVRLVFIPREDARGADAAEAAATGETR